MHSSDGGSYDAVETEDGEDVGNGKKEAACGSSGT